MTFLHLLVGSALAVPVEMNHQGRLLDASGAGVSGAHLPLTAAAAAVAAAAAAAAFHESSRAWARGTNECRLAGSKPDAKAMTAARRMRRR